MISKTLLIDDFVSQRLIQTDDGMGSYDEDWADELEFKGRLSLMSVNERMISDRQGVVGGYKIYANSIGDLDESYRVRLKDNSRTFEVTGVEKPSNARTGHYQIIVKEIL